MLKIDFSDSLDPSIYHVVARDIIAAIDTGAEFCVIDIGLATTFGLKKFESLKTHTAIGNAELFAYRGQIIVDSLYKMQVRFVGADLSGAVHQIVLGMDALRWFDIRISKKTGTVLLQWVGQ